MQKGKGKGKGIWQLAHCLSVSESSRPGDFRSRGYKFYPRDFNKLEPSFDVIITNDSRHIPINIKCGSNS